MYSLNVIESITCSRFGRMCQKNGWDRLEKRKIPFNMLIFAAEGTAIFEIETESYTISDGDILIIPAHTLYSAVTENYFEYYFFHFSGEIKRDEQERSSTKFMPSFSFDLPAITEKKLFFQQKTSNPYAYERIRESILSCMEYRFQLDVTNRLLFDAEFYKIMLVLSGVADKESTRIPATLKKMMRYVESNLTSPISLSDLCEYCGVSAPYVSRLFKNNLNLTATRYIHNKKLFYACELLKNTNMNISEIASYLGYNDVFYFSKLFKKEFGKSPKKYF